MLVRHDLPLVHLSWLLQNTFFFFVFPEMASRRFPPQHTQVLRCGGAVCSSLDCLPCHFCRWVWHDFCSHQRPSLVTMTTGSQILFVLVTYYITTGSTHYGWGSPVTSLRTNISACLEYQEMKHIPFFLLHWCYYGIAQRFCFVLFELCHGWF